jgi:hypothetical protein
MMPLLPSEFFQLRLAGLFCDLLNGPGFTDDSPVTGGVSSITVAGSSSHLLRR